MTNKNKILSLTTIAAISAILLVSVPGTAFGSAEDPVLILNPSSFTGSALPGGQVFMLEINMAFPFMPGDVVLGTTITSDCDDEIGLSGDIPAIFGDETEITVDFEITIASDAQTGFYVCETVFQVNDSGNNVLDTAPFNIFITVLRDELTLVPDSFTADAVPGQVFNLPINLEFPFVAGDLIFGFTITGDCDDDINIGGSAQNPTQPVSVITLPFVITIDTGAVIGDVLHCKTSFSISDSVNAVGVAEFNIWITVIRGQLVVTPDNIILDAVPGQVFNVDVDFEFPFEAADEIIGFVSFDECDDGIGPISGVFDPIDGLSNTVTLHRTITIDSDAEIGSSLHCVIRSQITLEDLTRVSPIVTFDIWVNVSVDQIENLAEGVDDLGLNNGNTKSLTKKLEQAIKNITNEDPTDDAEACEKLQSFINQLNAFVNAGKITQGEADSLIEVAEALIGVLCPD